ncbi:RNA polymerase sigma factor [Leptolyngbyaceae cyanobacterium UHCC 1019]
MNTSRDHIITEFSTFCTIAPATDSAFAWKHDLGNKKFMSQLTLEAPSVNPDCWARYFLLILQQQKRSVMESEFSQKECVDQMAIAVTNLVTQAAQQNQNLANLHDYLSSQNIHHLAQKLFDHQAAIVKQLLIAHLQRPSGFSAYQQHRRLPINMRKQFSLIDCLQESNQIISDPLHCLKNFDLTRSNITLKTYVEKKLRQQLTNIICVKLGTPRNFSDWGLLRHTPKKQLLEALQFHGLSELQIMQHRLIWHSFQEIYTAKAEGHSPLPPPSQAQLMGIRDRYKQRCPDFQLTPEITEPQVSSDLQTCIQAIRQYQNRTNAISPFDEAWHQNQDTNSETNDPLEREEFDASLNEEILFEVDKEDIEKDIGSDPLENLIDASDATKLADVGRITQSTVVVIFLGLERVAQTALRLNHGLDFNQAEIVQILGEPWKSLPQYQRSRQFNRWKKTFLDQLISAVRAAYPEVFPKHQPHDDRIQAIEQYLKWYLHQYCTQFFHPPLQVHYAALDLRDRESLVLRYFHQMDEAAIAQKLNLQSAQAVVEHLHRMMKHLSNTLKEWTQTTLEVDLNLCQSTPGKLSLFIETWFMNSMKYKSQSPTE